MMILLIETSTFSNILRVGFLFLIFVALLFGAHFFTKWYAKSGLVYPKTSNIKILESCQVSPGRTVMILKVGSRYLSVLLGKEYATVLTELEEAELTLEERQKPDAVSFKDFLQKAKKQKEKNIP